MPPRDSNSFLDETGAPRETENRVFGVLTNTGNLRDILAKGAVHPASGRRKHYRDLGDLAPDEVVLVSLPIDTEWIRFVTSEATHLSPVFLPLRDNAITATKVRELCTSDTRQLAFDKLNSTSPIVAIPGPLPLAAFGAIHFASLEKRDHFIASPRYGEDTLGLDIHTSIESADRGLQLPDKLPVVGDKGRPITRLLDARAGVLAALLQPGMGGGSRHIAIRTIHKYFGNDIRLIPALVSPLLIGVGDWLYNEPESGEDHQVASITRWLLEEFTRVGAQQGFAREGFLSRLGESMDSLPLKADRRQVVRDRINQISEIVSLATSRTVDTAEFKGPFLALLDYLMDFESHEGNNPPKIRTHEHRLTRLLHAARVGWSGLDTSVIDLEHRLLINLATCASIHQDNRTGLQFTPPYPLPRDHEGWMVETAAMDDKLQKKIFDRVLFDPCWRTEVQLPTPIGDRQVDAGARHFTVRGRVRIKQSLDMEQLTTFLLTNDLNDQTRKAAEKAMVAPRKRK